MVWKYLRGLKLSQFLSPRLRIKINFDPITLTMRILDPQEAFIFKDWLEAVFSDTDTTTLYEENKEDSIIVTRFPQIYSMLGWLQ